MLSFAGEGFNGAGSRVRAWEVGLGAVRSEPIQTFCKDLSPFFDTKKKAEIWWFNYGESFGKIK